ncbi:glycosyltransferase family 2 protein [Bacillus timonensis]|uniref:glycosyltransferase family 2 protein n=1 Tax=Bacillus timonensis TaxID=1033734 RepID=UPI000287AF9F|nr:glycosyltransferase [Bacillus timonensis]
MISVIVCTNRENMIENVFHNYDSQAYLDKELIIVLNDNDMDMDLWNTWAKEYHNVRVFQLDSSITLGECLNFAIEQSTYDFIAKFDDDDYYAPNYLNEAIEAVYHSKGDVIGKRSIYTYLEGSDVLVVYSPGFENTITKTVAGSTLFFKKDIWEKFNFPKTNVDADTLFLTTVYNNGYQIYSTSKLNHLLIRRKNSENHTWYMTDKAFLEDSETVDYKGDLKTFIASKE